MKDHGEARGARYNLAFSNIGEGVIAGAKGCLTEYSNVLLTNDHSCVGTQSGILEVLPDGGWVRGNCLGSGSPEYGF